jgi:hypothetical protein
MSASPPLIMIQFLQWVAVRPRRREEVLDAWQSSCPRFPVWEDARADGLVRPMRRRRRRTPCRTHRTRSRDAGPRLISRRAHRLPTASDSAYNETMTLQRAALWAVVIAATIFLLVAGRGLLLPFVLGIVLWYMVDSLADTFAQPRLGGLRLPQPLPMVLAILMIGGLFWIVGAHDRPQRAGRRGGGAEL